MGLQSYSTDQYWFNNCFDLCLAIQCDKPVVGITQEERVSSLSSSIVIKTLAISGVTVTLSCEV